MMSNKKQTAVECLINELYKKEQGLIYISFNYLFEKAKELEKQQIIDAWDLGRRDIDYPANGKQYYNETYGEQTAVEWWTGLSEEDQLLYFNKFKRFRKIKGLPIEQLIFAEIEQIFFLKDILIKKK